ncbi:MAG: hypothetical protein PHN44_08650 [Candidatus Marinimicrobia bacterium]|jgi:hypothetical protein|nr:hypothetical protein [Sphaerochaeta sp.]MDD5062327.1 hypothetical protein [Candidatus Neomarinimicrobiota bacterium]
MGWTPLFYDIVTSTIWTEDKDTRLLWITMLAIANENDDVLVPIPGLARLANLSIQETEKALAILKAPDQYSRTQDNEGRRIADIEGGWRVLNRGDYRAKIKDRRGYWREHKRKQRLKAKNEDSNENVHNLS